MIRAGLSRYGNQYSLFKNNVSMKHKQFSWFMEIYFKLFCQGITSKGRSTDFDRDVNNSCYKARPFVEKKV